MSPSLPAGDEAPPDGSLPATVRAGAEDRGFSVYLHVPYCAVRCGYCDFNTYVADELGAGSGPADYLVAVQAEFALAGRVLAEANLPQRPVSTVFVGGGTPTLLAPATLGGLVTRLRDTFDVAPDAEVTTEANPDSVTPQSLQTWPPPGSPECRSACSRRCRTSWPPWTGHTTRDGSATWWPGPGQPGCR